MKFVRRRFMIAAFSLFSALTVTLPAQAQTAGKEFTPITPVQPTEEPGKIEVLEFFSFGCPHCADFNPLLNAWLAKQNADVAFRKVPVTFGRAAWATIAKLHYALEVTGDAHRLEADVFRAIHQERENLFEEKALIDWVGKKGVDQKKFADTLNSFGVMSKVRRADQMAQSFKITGVPSLAIEGKYMVTGKDFNEVLANADKIIAKVRAEKAGKK